MFLLFLLAFSLFFLFVCLFVCLLLCLRVRALFSDADSCAIVCKRDIQPEKRTVWGEALVTYSNPHTTFATFTKQTPPPPPPKTPGGGVPKTG